MAKLSVSQTASRPSNARNFRVQPLCQWLLRLISVKYVCYIFSYFVSIFFCSVYMLSLLPFRHYGARYPEAFSRTLLIWMQCAHCSIGTDESDMMPSLLCLSSASASPHAHRKLLSYFFCTNLQKQAADSVPRLSSVPPYWNKTLAPILPN